MSFRRCRPLDEGVGTEKSLNFSIEEHDMISEFAEVIFGVGEGGLR